MIGIGAGAKAELNLGLLMGKRGPDPRLDAARPPARGEGADRARDGARVLPLLAAGAVTVPVAATLPARARPRRPTTTSPPGGKLGKIVLTM